MRLTHLPGEVALCGLPAGVSASALALIGLFNIAGSLTAGALGSRYRMKSLLALMYASRAVIIVIFLLAPKSALTFYILAGALGFTWLATVPASGRTRQKANTVQAINAQSTTISMNAAAPRCQKKKSQVQRALAAS